MKSITHSLSILALTVMICLSAKASAQVPPDLVHTAGGGMMRGTVLDYVPGDHLDLLLPTGEVRRIAGTDVLSVERVADTPAVTSPTTPASDVGARQHRPEPTDRGGPMVRLRITSARPGYTLLRETGIGAGVSGGQGVYVVAFERLCTAPCETEIEPGNQGFVVEDDTGRQRRAGARTSIERDGTLAIAMESRRPQRVRRWLTAIGMYVLAGVFTVSGFVKYGGECDSDYRDCPPARARWRFFGPAVAFAGAGYGLMFSGILARDRGRVDFTPDVD